VRSGKAQQVGVGFRLIADDTQLLGEWKMWVNGLSYDLPLKGVVVDVPLQAGENNLLFKIRQDEKGGLGAVKLFLTLGDPIFGVPNLTDVDWKALDGSWVPVNPKK
jgi:hypothetical protein